MQKGDIMWKRLAASTLAVAMGLAAHPAALAADLDDSDRAMYLGMTTWFASSPTWNAHFVVSLATPIGSTPWQLQTDVVPTLGSGHLHAAYRIDAGPVTLLPALGYRFFGAGSGTLTADTRGFELGPELRLGAILPLLSWLHIWGGLGYTPYLVAPYSGGGGSYLDAQAAVLFTVGRVSLSLGYAGLMFNGGQVGNPSGNVSIGGPTVGVLARF